MFRIYQPDPDCPKCKGCGIVIGRCKPPLFSMDDCDCKWRPPPEETGDPLERRALQAAFARE